MGDRESAVKAYATVIINDADSVSVSRAQKKLDYINEIPDDTNNNVSN